MSQNRVFPARPPNIWLEALAAVTLREAHHEKQAFDAVSLKMCSMPNVIYIRTALMLALFMSVLACQPSPSDQHAKFSIERQNPPTLVDPTAFGYSQVVTVNNGKLVFIAGQGPTNAEGKAVGRGDLKEQTRQAVDNILAALEAVGAGPQNIVYTRINVVDYEPKKLMQMASELARLKADGELAQASVFVGVESLIVPGTLIEIETVAAIP
jgi:enamine deaminase RidA (YjgF/YER057c/UK114 family)